MLTRYPDWPERLRAFLEQAARRPFSWAEFNCCLFAGDGVAAITGTDPAAALRGKFRNKREAYAALKRFVGEIARANPRAHHDLVAATAKKIAAELGCPEIPPLMAQRGDVVLIETRDCVAWDAHKNSAGQALGVCCGPLVAVLPAPAPGRNDGIAYVPLTDPRVRRAWRI